MEEVSILLGHSSVRSQRNIMLLGPARQRSSSLMWPRLGDVRRDEGGKAQAK